MATIVCKVKRNELWKDKTYTVHGSDEYNKIMQQINEQYDEYVIHCIHFS